MDADRGSIAYLDNASTTWPKPPSVHAAVDDASRRCGVNPGRSGSDMSVEAGAIIDGLRRELHALLGNPDPDPNRLVFAANATDALNTAILGRCRDGGHVVATRTEHNSVLRPLWELWRLGVIEHDLVPADGDGFVDPADVAAAIRPDTRLVVLNHASNVTGAIQDAAAVGTLCRERGVPLLLDAAQTAGVVPVDMAAMHVDLVAFTGHKGLLGPMGTGGLAVGPDVELATSRWGGTGVDSAVRGQPDRYPYRLEAGTPNLPGLAGLRAGLAWLRERGSGDILDHERGLAERMAKGVASLTGVRLHGTGSFERRVAIVNATVDRMSSDEVGARLDVDHDLVVRTGLQCAPLVHEDLGTIEGRGTVRFSFGPFNDTEQVERALAGLAECAEDALKRR